MLKDKKLLDPRKELVELSVFKWVLIVGLMLTAVSFILITYNSNLDWDFSYLGFNFFIVAFKVPLGLFTATISIIGLIALAHRSSQTKVQIDLSAKQFEASQQQNVFANYYKHIEEFEKHVENYRLHVKLNALNIRLSHHKLFPHIRTGDFTPRSLDDINFDKKTVVILKQLINLLNSLENELGKTCSNESRNTYESFANSTEFLVTEIQRFCGVGRPVSLIGWSDENISVEDINNCLSAIEYVVLAYMMLIGFEPNSQAEKYYSCFNEKLKLIIKTENIKDKNNKINNVIQYLQHTPKVNHE